MSQIASDVDIASKILKNIKPIIIVSRILGTLPYKYTETGGVTLKPIRIIYSTFIITLFSVTLSYIIFTTDLFSQKKKKEVTEITHIFNIVFESVTFITSVLSSLTRAKEVTKRLVNLIRTDKALAQLGVDVSFQETNRQVKTGIFSFFILLIIIFSIDYTVCFVYNVEKGITFVQWFFLVVLFFYNRLVSMQFVNFIFILRRRFLALNVEMENLKTPDIYQINIRAKNQKITTVKPVGLPLKKKIMLMKEIHDLLTGLCNQSNDFASVRNLLHIAINTVTITSHLYIIASMLIDTQYQWHIFAYSIYWCLFRTADLFMVIYICANTSFQANHTAIVIHDLLSSGEMMEVSEKLEHFSIQLLHHKICFTACDFFPIDFTLIYSMAGTVATYLIILIQFKMSN